MGSLAHDEVYAVAAVGWRGRLVGLGVDIEPAEPLPEDLLDLVLRPPEQSETEGDGVARRLVFAAKEAVFKAVYPLNRTAFEYPDVEVRLREKTATLRDGRRLRARHAARRLAGRGSAGVCRLVSGPEVRPSRFRPR